MTRKAKILVVDDHPMLRNALRHFIESEKHYCVCAEAETQKETLGAIERCRPDLILLDLFLREDNGINLTKVIRSKYARLPIVVLTLHRREIFSKTCLQAGANGYVMKSEASEELMPAIRSALRRKKPGHKGHSLKAA